MKKAFILSIITMFSVITFAQKNTPKYSQYPAKVEKKTAKKVNLKSHSEAKFFRTNLKNALANAEVNFAGKYILAYWGCGSGCTQGAIIDVQTGNVFFPVELQGVYAGGLSLGEHDKLEYKNNSNLLVIYGYAGGGFNPETETQHGIYYYRWNGKAFKLLRFIKKKE
ncbi:MAG: hypothetical protein PHC28_09200 [Flavobacterium sp.]|uniref:hypothetical protein n=1 Tax=Flavobacterium sp. TaxID=239 RepID=UPI00262D0B2F|nr:hypothetical protein [Flavobacterium sp.]MDD5150645.1 hypothetical protein [Flavobacterium sp.]